MSNSASLSGPLPPLRSGSPKRSTREVLGDGFDEWDRRRKGHLVEARRRKKEERLVPEIEGEDRADRQKRIRAAVQLLEAEDAERERTIRLKREAKAIAAYSKSPEAAKARLDDHRMEFRERYRQNPETTVWIDYDGRETMSPETLHERAMAWQWHRERIRGLSPEQRRQFKADQKTSMKAFNEERRLAVCALISRMDAERIEERYPVARAAARQMEDTFFHLLGDISKINEAAAQLSTTTTS